MNSFKPDGWPTVNPRIITSEPDQLVGFVKAVFGGTGDFLVNRPTEIRIGDSMIMISDGSGLREAVSAFLYVYVENVDQTYQRAVEAGAESLESPADLPYWRQKGDGEGPLGQPVADCFAEAWQVATAVCKRFSDQSER
jgi:PhnB protein